MNKILDPRQNICIVVGTRPEAIKMAPVYFALQKSASLRPVLLSTGQHREMLDQALAAFSLTPDHDLNLMQPGQSLADITSRVISSVFDYLVETRPAAVLVQGDTTTVFATALAAFYAGIPVGHVEAGLRTHDPQNPWPEEMNRRLVAPIARWHFCPTVQSREHLLSERIDEANCFVTGNTVVDALLWIRGTLAAEKRTAGQIARRVGIGEAFAGRFLDNLASRWILVTGHRRESHGPGFVKMCEGILRLVTEHSDLGILFPVHLNPRVREPVMQLLGDHDRIELIEPAGYEDFIWLMDRCTFLLSDSGGVQEEAPSLGKPVLVTRETTERPEGIAAGTCRLVGTDPDRIFAEAELLLCDADEFTRRSGLKNPYGDGSAADRIRQILEKSMAANGT
ncbi:UDP-N-acetylglucosamine 2-epimerase [Rosistilla ulvae]|uniref:UDP-N-acetylglucosamine 2-epimerase (non-hydrolyzing) n=1 Tax=Rosistilla ulvae TaxID=1930277 RepID=A0A517M234_9BACT|nr:UDP-N-acetylglucosamine 2-epimerase (non-hydrolyzing) [Rosistilla ulvae]QDS88927.1 UDP-N-acetylglucosamine 2-epimerase [Rosistilla ulvae]